MFQVAKFLSLRFIPANLTDHIEEVRGTCKGSAFLLYVSSQVVGKNFNHGLGGELVHGVVLVVAPGEVSEHVPGQLVDALDDLRHVSLEISSGKKILQLGEVLVRDLSLEVCLP